MSAAAKTERLRRRIPAEVDKEDEKMGRAANARRKWQEREKPPSDRELEDNRRQRRTERHLACPQCGKSFRFKGNLEAHTRTHTEERPYACTLCGTRFRRRHHLLVHERTHTGERPFKCDVCDKAFRKKYHLTRHAAVHAKVAKVDNGGHEQGPATEENDVELSLGLSDVSLKDDAELSLGLSDASMEQ